MGNWEIVYNLDGNNCFLMRWLSSFMLFRPGRKFHKILTVWMLRLSCHASIVRVCGGTKRAARSPGTSLNEEDLPNTTRPSYTALGQLHGLHLRQGLHTSIMRVLEKTSNFHWSCLFWFSAVYLLSSCTFLSTCRRMLYPSILRLRGTSGCVLAFSDTWLFLPSWEDSTGPGRQDTNITDNQTTRIHPFLSVIVMLWHCHSPILRFI